MEFSNDWKHFFPIGAASSTVSPLLLPSSSSSSSSSSTITTGPLFFNPIPHSITNLFSSSSLIPPLHLPPILFSFRFLQTSDSSSILPSIASSLASLSPSLNDTASSYFLHSRIHVLNYPNTPKAFVFFPTGANDDQLGYFTVSVKDSQLHPQLDHKGEVFHAETGSSAHRILRIVVNPVADFGGGGIDDDGGDSPVIGYVLASTLYSVHWFVVRDSSVLDRASVSYLGGKVFKTCLVVHACWSPHILEECVVLLEGGQLYLFDLESHCSSLNFRGTRFRVPWSDSENKVWISCEFSWHPRILVVASSDAVFLVDLRSKECHVSCLMKIEMLRMYAPGENELFLALTRAGPDHFYFTVASSSLLLLCDVRKPMMPVLQWVHDIDRPNYMTVLNLSMMRSHSREDTFKLASESGFCIILGSFWNFEFNLFCYGPELPFRIGTTASKLSKIDRTFCAWGLPSEITLTSGECHCGSCLLREELSKDALPEWVDWQLKKEMVMGFGILSNELSALLCEPYEHGGFTLIRLMSSGRLESQRYHAAWVPAKNSDHCHEPESSLDRHLLYPMNEEKYKFPRKFPYLKLDHLYAYASGHLPQFLVKKLEKCCVDAQEKESFAAEVHEFLCEKLSACGFGRLKSSPAAIAVFEDVKPPASFHEVALRRLWADLPLELLQLAFLNHSECRELLDQMRLVSDFLAVPCLPQLPPFFLRKTTPHSDDDIVGPVVPFPVLLVLNEFYNGCSDLEGGEFSVEAEVSRKYNEVIQVAGDIVGSTHGSTLLDVHAVSLADDGDETWNGSSKRKSFLSYRPVALNCSTAAGCSDRVHDTFIFRVLEKSADQTESVGQEIFDDLCPVELRFDAPVNKFEPQGLKAYNLLKKQMSKWQRSFDSFKKFSSDYNLD